MTIEKKHIQFKDSYKIWKPYTMVCMIEDATRYFQVWDKYRTHIIEWWLHNIGYWLTLPFSFVPFIEKINLRCKDVDLMVDVPVERSKV